MKANHLVVTKKDVDLDIAGITLLTAEDYLSAKLRQPSLKGIG